MTKHLDLSTVDTQLASVTEDGMNLEMCYSTPDGELSELDPYPIAWSRPDVEGQIKSVVGTPEGTVSLP